MCSSKSSHEFRKTMITLLYNAGKMGAPSRVTLPRSHDVSAMDTTMR